MENTLTIKAFEAIEERCTSVGMKKETFLKEASFAVQMFNKNSYLNSATQESKLRCVYNVALTGLTLNPVQKLAYLVPRYNSQINALEACLEPSYVGLVKLVTDTGSAKSVTANIVYQGDTFELDLFNNTAKHTPFSFTGKDKGQIIGCYVRTVLMDGGIQIEWMTKAETDEIKTRSESYKSYLAGKAKSCIWVSDETEMMRKTVIKRATKYLPRTEQWERLQNAISIDNEDYKATDSQIQYIESLLSNCSLDVEVVLDIEREMNTCNRDRAGEIIEMLKQNQLDPITQTGIYNAGDISKRQREILSQK